jgi:hypothetical protein
LGVVFAGHALNLKQIFGAAQETTSVERHSTPLYIIVGQIPSVGQQIETVCGGIPVDGSIGYFA